MKKIFSIIIVLLSFMVQSCVITQEYTINKDLSGSSVLTFDFSKFNDAIGNYYQDSSKNEFFDTLRNGFNEIFKDKNQYKNWKYREKSTGVFEVSYDFDNFANPENGTTIDVNGKTMTISLYSLSNAEETKEILELANDESLFEMNVIFHFDRIIKKVSVENAEISSDKKTVKIKNSITKFPYENITIQFKK